MKVALLISGYLRSFETNLQNIKEKILDKFDTVDVYLHITENEETEDRYLNKNPKNLIQKIKENLSPVVCLIEPNISFSKNNKKNILYNQWVKFYKLNELKKINEKVYGEYNLVIKLRPDLYIVSEINFSEINYNDFIFIPKDSKIDKNKLLNPQDGFLTDTFAFGKSSVMNFYFDIFENLNTLSKEYGFTPETILYEYLKNKSNVFEFNLEYYIILSTCNIFAICGDSGSGKSTLGNLLKKYFHSSFLLECDRYHKWERYDKNWSNFTHLNPEANFIAKMNQDIFDLKVGKKVYHVDYDHSTGKFTQKEKIKNSENLIVCGLHSLYDNNNLYNLKIYMDTDEKLKKKWKIQRDVNQRGYTLDKVLSQIENRKKDYEDFIHPQKKDSNVVINFYINDDNDSNIKLKILISLDLNYEKLINIFSKSNLNPNIEYTEKFISINFGEYCDSEIFEILNFKNYDFYDHIIFTLLNIN